MLSLIEERGAQIAVLCRRFHVRRLDVFGSAARGDSTRREATSIFSWSSSRCDRRLCRRLFRPQGGIEQLFGRPVDLVSAASIRNPYFRQSVERTKALLYAA